MAKGKGPGYDGITVELICRIYKIIKDDIVRLFNKMLPDGSFLVCWKYGVVIALYKGQAKDPTLVKSYCPLTFLPVIGKLCELIINARIYKKLNNNNKLLLVERVRELRMP